MGDQAQHITKELTKLSENDEFHKEQSLIFADANIDRSALTANLSKFLSENSIDTDKIFK